MGFYGLSMNHVCLQIEIHESYMNHGCLPMEIHESWKIIRYTYQLLNIYHYMEKSDPTLLHDITSMKANRFTICGRIMLISFENFENSISSLQQNFVQ